MYIIHLKGNKTAVLLTWANLRGYDEAEITYEEGPEEEYVLHCEISTKWDQSPFIGKEKEWAGETEDLSQYDEALIRSGAYYDALEGYDPKYLSGFLGIEIEVLRKPDDDSEPICEFKKYSNGKCVESSNFANEDCDLDMDMFEVNQWHDFTF